jgi:hypothetical protein
MNIQQLQSYTQRLALLHRTFGYDFNKRSGKKGKLFFGHNQWEFEQTDAAIARMATKPITRFVELGVNWGTSMFMLSRFLAPRSTIVGVDCGLFPGIHDVHKVLEFLRGEGHEVQFFNMKTVDAVHKVGSGAQLLHIDAGHTYDDAKSDWMNYTPLVEAGGLILLHDIAYTSTPDVSRFWAEIKPSLSTYHEIIETKNGKPNGKGMAVVVKTW